MRQKNTKKFSKTIIGWYGQNARNLPWRKTKDPFKILVAEFLLQKTDVNKVGSVYKAFIERWPNPHKLYKAKVSSIIKIIQPLGLKYKAKRLKSVAKVIAEKYAGEVPELQKELLRLVGVGRYIASALECFAFHKPVAVLDTNVIRILNRVFGLQSKRNRPRDDIQLWQEAQNLLPKSKVREYNWGLLDYGALVCKSNRPLCGQCQMKKICLFYKNSIPIRDNHRKKIKDKFTAIDLFAGAGGLSLGFEKSGYEVIFALENDKHCVQTYKKNRRNKKVKLIIEDIAKVNFKKILKDSNVKKGTVDIVMGGPPCQGFSISNMRTRNSSNPQNKLFIHFLRAVKEIKPKWVLFENVAGIATFEKGKVTKKIQNKLKQLGYTSSWQILDAAYYGVPQHRRRLFLVGNRLGIKFCFPKTEFDGENKPLMTVKDAISDLPFLKNGSSRDVGSYKNHGFCLSEYQKFMRKWHGPSCKNNLVTRNSEKILLRYKYIRQGGNWDNVPKRFMRSYDNLDNCHSGIYKRLRWNKPSVVISNFRKAMLIHPSQNRGLSVREAARIQSFPDRYVFFGPLGSIQQQVANAVPPILAQRIANSIINCDKK